jgi:hypothetical protein
MEIADAKALTIPHIVLASNGEPGDVVKEYYDLLVGEGKPNGKLFPLLMGGSELARKSESHLLTGVWNSGRDLWDDAPWMDGREG